MIALDNTKECVWDTFMPVSVYLMPLNRGMKEYLIRVIDASNISLSSKVSGYTLSDHKI
jgi:hypothetical protein